jgi:hypothetical protein
VTDRHEAPEDLASEAGPPDDDEIRTLLARLGRPHRSGGTVVERATLLAAGADFTAIVAWIEAHGGVAEELVPPRTSRGLHSRPTSDVETSEATPLRFILPSGALR